MCDYLYLYCGDQTDLGQAACVTIFISIVVIRQIWDRLHVHGVIWDMHVDYLYLYCGDQTDLGQAACVTIFISIVVIRLIWDRLHV